MIPGILRSSQKPDGYRSHRSLFGILIAAHVSGVLTVGYWQYEMQRYKEALYAEKIERAAKRAEEASEAKTRFLFNMSHDIRTPMNAIHWFSDLLEKHSG